MRRLAGSDPRRIGHNDLLAVIGDGSMGRVYLGRARSGRLLAIKAIRPDLARDPVVRQRFGTEIAVAQRVSGAYSAPVAEAAPEASTPWLATAFIAGPTLHAAVAENGPLAAGDALALAGGLAEALRAVHGAGVVHRDIKPANILLDHAGPRVIDFGIARFAEWPGGPEWSAAQGAAGTTAFMAPEQSMGGPASAASDVYALGAVLCYATTGRAPFGDDSAAAVQFRAAQLPPDLREVPEALVPLVEACLNKDPNRRPAPERILSGLPAGSGKAWPPADIAALIDARAREADAFVTGERAARTRRRVLAGAGSAVLALVLAASGIAAVRAGLLPGTGGDAEAGESPAPSPVTSRDTIEGDVAAAPESGAEFHPEATVDDLVETLFVPQRGGTVTDLEFHLEDPDVLYDIGLEYSEDWDLSTGEQRMPSAPMVDFDSNVLAVSPDGEALAAGTNSNTVYAGEPGAEDADWGRELANGALSEAAETPEETSEDLPKLEDVVTGLAFSRDGQTVVAAFGAGQAHVLDASDGSEIAAHETERDLLAGPAAAHPTEDVFAVEHDQEIVLLDSGTGEEIDRFDPEASASGDLEYTADGEHLILAGVSEFAEVIDADTGEQVATMRGHGEPVDGVASTPDGTVVATVARQEPQGDSEVRLWDVGSGEEIGLIQTRPSRGALDFSADGTRLALGHNDGAISVWHLPG
ncbi:hypothetical protein F4561_000456 [Lipingzhangella halophila]|uniref:Protein kinase domain-containing protein n=1 Tax=Lipingzhangella halophila TaxID=1783352 RepID=A0A7W7RDW4_9ACTN|nr:serine/threonine-protein kinase [Lipingzhangella halophila]MBB4929636.1 hypothetical protein [Lipingzhangella halophila]